MTEDSIEDVGLLLKVIYYAAEKHVDQRRKNEKESPYINHPIKVAKVIWEDGCVRDMDVIAAALLHDTIEDTGVREEELAELFSPKIASIVKEVTDDKDLDKQIRKQKQIEHAPHLSFQAKQVKLGDKICNVEDIQNNPPAKWTDTRREEYLDWACQVVNGLRGANPLLEARFVRSVSSARETLRNH
jgi:GTP diphosphokinase / guanosine-3',5'-bis(diphosphate) 3'-diphosphatase